MQIDEKFRNVGSARHARIVPHSQTDHVSCVWARLRAWRPQVIHVRTVNRNSVWRGLVGHDVVVVIVVRQTIFTMEVIRKL